MATAGYSGTPLVKKLGIKSGMRVAIAGAPQGFRRELVGLPQDVRLSPRIESQPDLILWFVQSRRAMEGMMPAMATRMGDGLWVAWPKKASGVHTDVTEDVIRNAGLANGLVDYKVCLSPTLGTSLHVYACYAG
jgi:hypothetical protein